MGAKDPDTFSPTTISLPKDKFESMMRGFRLPLRGIETTAVVGPFFWSGLSADKDDPRLEILHQKSDVRKKGRTRGWQLMLSHSFRTRITTGYIKGTPSSDVVRALAHLKASAAQAAHPLLLPVILLSYDLSPANDRKQREARDWLRRLENAVSLRQEVDETEQYFQDGMLEIDGLSRDLVECHGHVMWKRPQAYMALADEVAKAMDAFMTTRQRFLCAAGDPDDASQEAATNGGDGSAKVTAVNGTYTLMGATEREERRTVDELHHSMLSRLDFYQAKLKGLENYIFTTLERLKVQREAVCLFPLYHPPARFVQPAKCR
jgi:hypothetical protein